MKKLFLLDAMALIYRAYYALNKNPRINSKGLNTSAILGFANTLYDLLKNEKPTHIGVAFDTMAPTARHIDFTAYKANRESMPEDLAASIPYIKELIESFRIPVLFVDGYEADDVIGTLAKRAENEGFRTFMMTPDKDFGQLVTENIFMYRPGKFNEPASIMGIKEVCEKFGIKRPDQVIDMLGLWGDASDNIPGIPGVGEVTAKKLLETWDNIENLIAHASEIKNEKLKEKVIQHAESAIMSKQLATIILDVPIEWNEEELKLKEPDRQRLKELLDELEFRTFAKRVFTDLSLKDTAKQQSIGDLFSSQEETIETHAGPTFNNLQNTKHTYTLINDESGRQNLLNLLTAQPHFCFDTETTGLDPNNCELVGMSFSWKKGEAYYMHMPANFGECKKILQEFKSVLENPAVEKTGQNLKYDISVLKQYGIQVSSPLFDTMLAHYLIQPDSRHNMDFLAETWLNYSPVSIETLIGKKGKDQGNMRNADLEKLKEYAAEDADITWQLREVFLPKLEESDTRVLLDTMEMPLIPVLADMEAEGVRIDKDILTAYSGELELEIRVLEQEILDLAGMSFNISSPKQLGEVLFDHLKIVEKPKQTSKTKQYSTGEEVLQKLLHTHPIVQKILDYRSLTKLKSTYVDTLPALINQRTGRIHTTYNQAVAATGRLSSNNPNLQNIPVRTDRGREIRKAFVPRNSEYLLLSADYSQIELRIIAALSGDVGMTEAFRSGLDIHTATAAKVYGVPVEEVTKEMRRNAKTVNFGIIYGISAFGLSERLSIMRKEAADLINQYFAQYPGIRQFMDDSIEFAKKHGYVETIMKRRRYLRDINSANAIVRGFAERNAINAPVQGSAADMIKIAMIRIHNEMKKRNLQSKMIMQVHDELVFDAHRSEVEELKSIVADGMKNAMQLAVPLEIEMSTGENWLEAH
jgi:DNA polymerase-1